MLVLPSVFDDKVTSVINSYRLATRGEPGNGNVAGCTPCRPSSKPVLNGQRKASMCQLLTYTDEQRMATVPQLRSFVNFEFCRPIPSLALLRRRQEFIVSSCFYEASAFLGMRYHKTAATRNNAGISPSRFARSVSSTIA